MRISDWSSDVCSADLSASTRSACRISVIQVRRNGRRALRRPINPGRCSGSRISSATEFVAARAVTMVAFMVPRYVDVRSKLIVVTVALLLAACQTPSGTHQVYPGTTGPEGEPLRSEEHTSEL